MATEQAVKYVLTEEERNVNIKPFELERYFARYEFSTRYLLSSSDCDGLPMARVLEYADAEARELWDNLTLGYTESPGLPLLRREIAGLYEGISPEQVLEVVPEEGIFLAMSAILRPGDHVVCTFPGYQSLYQVAESIGCTVTWWQPDEAQGWRFDLDFLRRSKFLGFTLHARDKRLRLATASVTRVKEKIRSVSQWSAAVSMSGCIGQLNQYMGGWVGYFALSEVPSVFSELEEWPRCRLRMCHWKQWKRIRTRVYQLSSMGLKEVDVWGAAGSHRSYWRTAGAPSLQKALNKAYWQGQELMALADRYQAVRKVW